jgi:hypothetical protein
MKVRWVIKRIPKENEQTYKAGERFMRNYEIYAFLYMLMWISYGLLNY